MKVMHLVQHLEVGGLEKMAITLLKNSQYSQTTIIVSLEGDKESAIKQWPELSNYKSSVFCLNKAPGFKGSVIKKLKALIKEQQIDIIHSHHIGPLLYAGIVCSLTTKRIRHVSTIHDAWYLNNIKQRFFTRALNLLTHIHWVADANIVANEFQSKTSIIPQQTILNGIDCEQFKAIDKSCARQQLNLPENVKLIGCAARLIEGKGHKDLIHALIYLPENYHLVFAGDGDQRDLLHKAVESYDLKSRVHFLGNIHDMRVFYSSIDVMCLYSKREGLPLSIIEAMSCGVPIVASDVGGIHEVVTDKEGELIAANNYKLIAPAILRTLQLPNGNPIRHHAIAVADARTMSSQYDNLYTALA